MARTRVSKAAARQVLAAMRDVLAEVSADAHEYDDVGSLTRRAWAGLLGVLGHAGETTTDGMLPADAFEAAVRRASARRKAS